MSQKLSLLSLKLFNMGADNNVVFIVLYPSTATVTFWNVEKEPPGVEVESLIKETAQLILCSLDDNNELE